MTPADERILRQYGKKLSQPDIFLQASKDERFQITSERKPAAKKSAIMIDAKYVRCWQRADLLEDHGSGKLVLSDQGRSWLRRQQAAHMPYMAQHQARCEQQLQRSALWSVTSVFRLWFGCGRARKPKDLVSTSLNLRLESVLPEIFILAKMMEN